MEDHFSFTKCIIQQLKNKPQREKSKEINFEIGSSNELKILV